MPAEAYMDWIGYLIRSYDEFVAFNRQEVSLFTPHIKKLQLPHIIDENVCKHRVAVDNGAHASVGRFVVKKPRSQ